MPDQLMTIGSFSMVSGLSISTLRHYDEVGLLRPADVDPHTSYRRYGYTQIDIGSGPYVRPTYPSSRSPPFLSVTGGRDRETLVERRAELDERAG